MTVMSLLSAKPQVLPVQPENIPELLRQQRSWVCWKAGPLKANGKFDKVPVDLRTGRNVNGREPAQWRTFAQVMDAYRKGAADGIGFALSELHPVIVDGDCFYVIVADFDHCTANMDELLVTWRELGQPFVEVSPSKNGLHMWGLCRSPLRGGNAGNHRELYSGGRFVTMTGVSAKGTFRECPEFITLEQQWFPLRKIPAVALPLAPVVGIADLPGNLVFGQSGDHWFDQLLPDDKNACLAAMLQVPAVIDLADTPDAAPSPNWRTVVAACVRSGASNAYNLCRAWAATSPRFDPGDFDLRWRSYARG